MAENQEKHENEQHQYPPQYQQQQQYHQPQQYQHHHQHQTVVLSQPGSILLGVDPTHMTCPICNHEIITSIKREPGMLTWMACLGLCVIGCDLGCCFIPFCVDSCQDTVHHCPNCRTALGRKNAM